MKKAKIQIKYENGRCQSFKVDGKEVSHKIYSARIEIVGGEYPILTVKTLLQDAEIEIEGEINKD